MPTQKQYLTKIKIWVLGLLGLECYEVEDTLYNRVKALKNDDVFDILTCCGYIKKNGVVIHSF